MPEELLCYNRSCGKQFKADENTKDSCTFHPGVPVFHDAYKGWSCCRKKCTDFTEFLNIKGCTVSFHSNVKPPEPEKPVVDKVTAAEVVSVRAPLEADPPRLARPPFDTPLVKVKPNVAASLAAQVKQLVLKGPSSISQPVDVAVGTSCKNNGCKASYPGAGEQLAPCQHHPGVPVFHEGLKYWSCCTKRTTEFSVFLEQVGCVQGVHKWSNDAVGSDQKPMCRHDWHQTASDVIISVYAKKYDPEASSVQLNPIRAKIDIIFPENNANFAMDLELRGVIDVEKSEVSMLGTKIEIKMKKAEAGSWSHLDFPRVRSGNLKPTPKTPINPDRALYDDDPVDLSDIN